MVFLCANSLVLSAESVGRRRDVKIGAEDRASLEGESGACSV